ncbi:MAG: UDP-N-acetylmuramoyl-L-alanine--D-glutamate ligase, partial [Thermomonas sp.]
MRISQLEAIVGDGGRVALWGWGREGRAAYHAIRAHLPELPLTLFCNAAEADEVRAMGDRWLCPAT